MDNKIIYGPCVPECEEMHASKYRLPNESFEESQSRNAAAMSDSEEHRKIIKEIYLSQRFLNAGRVQSAMGSPRMITAFNCFVMGTLPDSLDGIFDSLKEAAITMQKGGGIGYDFSTLRPKGAKVKSVDADSSGPVSFMEMWNAMCKTIMSAGSRRGAMMAVMRCDHPDIEEFIRAKRDGISLSNFNTSVGITDDFMHAVLSDGEFNLVFEGNLYKTIKARPLFDEIMRNTWDWAEPGVLFLDTINRENNLYYVENITATNPCGEQPLPPYGACLLGSFNLVEYVIPSMVSSRDQMGIKVTHQDGYEFDYKRLILDVPYIVRALDNVIDNTIYPLPKQEEEAKNKRRMGIGITALANTLTMLDIEYGSKEAVKWAKKLMKIISTQCYSASSDLALEKGSFPAYQPLQYLQGDYIKRLPKWLIDKISLQGIRNSHLISIAPTGTISFTADNVSSGMEPVFAHEVERVVNKEFGPAVVKLKDYVWNFFGLKCKTSEELTIDEHLNMQIVIQPYVDSAVSKTINVGDNITFNEFRDVYIKAWKGKLKGITTYRASGELYGVLHKAKEDSEACYIDPATGGKTCG